MTRIEAENLMQEMNPECDDCEQAIATFVALGMLKLDEPKVEPKYSSTVLATVAECRSLYGDTVQFLDALQRHGVTFVQIT